LIEFYFDENNESSILSYQKLLQDMRRWKYFSELGIDKNQHQAFKYISIGIAEHSYLFLDMSLIKFIADNHRNEACYSLLLKLVPLYPSESRLLDFFNQKLSFPNLAFSERFLLYQVHQVKCFRQSHASFEITLKLIEMKIQAKRGINFSRKFWLNTSFKLSFLTQIKNSIGHINSWC
jgi:hypothetical protein